MLPEKFQGVKIPISTDSVWSLVSNKALMVNPGTELRLVKSPWTNEQYIISVITYLTYNLIFIYE